MPDRIPPEPAIAYVCVVQVGVILLRAVYCVIIGGHLTDVVMPDKAWAVYKGAITPHLDMITEPTAIDLQHILLPSNAAILGIHKESGVRFWAEVAQRIIVPTASAAPN